MTDFHMPSSWYDPPDQFECECEDADCACEENAAAAAEDAAIDAQQARRETGEDE